MQGTVQAVRRYGVDCYRARILDATGQVIATAVHMSEQGARTWILKHLK